MRASRPTFLTPRTTPLHGVDIALRPLSRRDASELIRVPDDPGWDLLLRRPAGGGASADAWLADALKCMRRGVEHAWTIRDRLDGRLLGSTRYLNVDLANRRLEIGATWLLPEARGSVANLEAKLLQLDHAFSALGIRRVHVQADVRNERSRRAIEGLGATFEGVLRSHIVLPDGTSRDTAVYSIVDAEWPELRAALVERIADRTASWRALPSSLAAHEASSMSACVPAPRAPGIMSA